MRPPRFEEIYLIEADFPLPIQSDQTSSKRRFGLVGLEQDALSREIANSSLMMLGEPERQLLRDCLCPRARGCFILAELDSSKTP